MSLKSKIAALIAAGIIAATPAFAAGKKKTDLHAGVGFTAQLDYASYTVEGDEAQTTPIHSQDGGSSRGEATADIDGVGSPALTLGLEGSVGLEMLKLVAGVKARYNPVSASDPEGYRSGIYEVRLQPLPSPYESYSYTKLIPDPFTYTPFVGIEGEVFDFITLRGEVGFPHSGYTIVTGWDRYGHFEAGRETHASGTGISFGSSLGLRFTDNTSAYFNLAKEMNKLDFDGNDATINTWVGSLGIRYVFEK